MSKYFANSVALSNDSQVKEKNPGMWLVEENSEDFLTASMEMGLDEAAARKLFQIRGQLPHDHKEVVAEIRRNYQAVKKKMEELEVMESSLNRLLTLAEESHGREVNAALRLLQINNF